MISRLMRVGRVTMTQSKIPRPRDPSCPESYETSFSDKELKRILDPKGFVQEYVTLLSHIQTSPVQYKPTEQPTPPAVTINVNRKLEPEFGMKPKGPYPTRYGDWEIKGKCVDF